MPFRDPVDSQQLLEHRKRIRRCCGTACLVEAMIGTRARSANHLETLITGERPKMDRYGQPMWSGLCRRWREGISIPSDESIARIESISEGRSNVAFWRDHTLWLLLSEPVKWRPELLKRLWVHMGEPVRRLIFVGGGPAWPGMPVVIDIGDRDVGELRAMKTLDSFVALLMLARLAEISNSDARHAVMSASAFSILANVVWGNSQLAAAKDDLFKALHTVFWSYWYLHGVRQKLPRSAFNEHLALLTQFENAECNVCIGSLANESVPVAGRTVDQFCSVIGLTG